MPSLTGPLSDHPIAISSLRHSLARARADHIGQCSSYYPSRGESPQENLQEIADMSYKLCGLLLQTFPTELLVRIFLEVPAYRWPKKRSDTFYQGDSDVAEICPEATRRPPWVFSHVCQRWREIVFSTPQLWTVVPTVDLSSMYANPLLEQHLLRSDNKVPLSICCEHSGSSVDKGVTSCLSQYVESMEELTFLLRNRCLPSFHEFQGHFRSLRAFHLVFFSPRAELGIHLPPGMFMSAPALEELTLMHPLITPPQLPPSLKKYHGYYHGASATLEFLARVPQLESCTFETPLSYPRGETHPPLPKRPRLSMLKLHTLGLVNCSSVQEFLKHIYLPRLHHLQLSFYQRREPIIRSLTAALLSWAKESGWTSLRILNLAIHGSPEAVPTEIAHDLSNLFSATPELEWLSYTTSVSHSAYTFVPLFGNRMLLPHLRTLLLDFGYLSPQDLALVLDMVEYRRSRPNLQSADYLSMFSASSGLTFFTLRNVEENDIRGNRHRLDWGHDPSFSRLKDIAWMLARSFEIPLDENNVFASQNFQQNLQLITKPWNIQSVLASGLHISLSKLLLRGSPSNPDGYETLEKCRNCVDIWRIQSKCYFQESRWFMFQNALYWQAGGEPDAHEMFWEISPPRDGIPRHRRDPPLTYVDPIKNAHWKPEWELAACH